MWGHVYRRVFSCVCVCTHVGVCMCLFGEQVRCEKLRFSSLLICGCLCPPSTEEPWPPSFLRLPRLPRCSRCCCCRFRPDKRPYRTSGPRMSFYLGEESNEQRSEDRLRCRLSDHMMQLLNSIKKQLLLLVVITFYNIAVMTTTEVHHSLPGSGCPNKFTSKSTTNNPTATSHDIKFIWS